MEEILKNFSLEEIIFLEENYDKQFLAIKKLVEKDFEKACKFSVINASVSYALIMTGENYWLKFSEYFLEKDFTFENFLNFLKTYNPIQLEAKIKRARKIYEWIKSKEIITDLVKFNKELAKVLNQKEDSKTIVFSTKIYGYCLRAKGLKIIFPFEIFIPIDKRISRISKEKDFWINLSKKLKIPLLHIDSLIWITFGLSYEEISKMEEKLKEKILKLKIFLERNYANRLE